MSIIGASGPALELSIPGSFSFDGWAEVDALAGGGVAASFRFVANSANRTAVVLLDDDATGIARQREADEGGARQRTDTSVVALADGGFAVTWDEFGDEDPLTTRVFNAKGRAVSDERLVFDDIDFSAVRLDSGPLPGGGYVVVGGDQSPNAVYARAFDADGTPLRGSFELEDHSGSAELTISKIGGGRLAIASGRAVQIVDRRGRPEGEPLDVTLGRFAPVQVKFVPYGEGQVLAIGLIGSAIYSALLTDSLAPIGDAVLISGGDGEDVRADVTLLADGSALVAWVDRSNVPTIAEAVRLDPEGRPLGDVAYLAGTGIAQVTEVNVTGLADGSFVLGTGLSEFGATVSNAMAQRFATDVTEGAVIGNNKGRQMDGTNGDDLIAGRGGKDTIEGGRGDDVLYGQRGNDSLVGGNGDDILGGDAGNDRASGSNGDDTLLGGAGKDRLKGDGGADSLIGGADRDRLEGGAKGDTLEGGDGNDDLRGGSGADLMNGGEGDDLQLGGAGADTLVAGAGSDTLTGGNGADQFIIRRDGGAAEITDFDTDADRLDLDGWAAFGQSSGDFIRLNGRPVEGGVQFSSSGTTVTLLGIDDPEDMLGVLFV